MDSQARWTGLCHDISLNTNITQALTTRGYTTASMFSYAITNNAALETLIQEILVTRENVFNTLGLDPNDWATSPHAATLRRLWNEAWQLCQGPGQSSSSAFSLGELSWTDQPPPRLGQELQQQMKSDFKTNYPSEILNSESMPGPRYWAAVYNMFRADQKVSWLPWVQIVSEKKHGEIKEAKGSRAPRTETQMLANLCWDEIPQLDDADLVPVFQGLCVTLNDVNVWSLLPHEEIRMSLTLV